LLVLLYYLSVILVVLAVGQIFILLDTIVRPAPAMAVPFGNYAVNSGVDKVLLKENDLLEKV
jgi:hypothetical protein